MPPADRRRVALVAIVVIGLGLAVAPAAFGMFTRAPEGGRMIDEFRPYMTGARIERFRGFMDEIGAAAVEVEAAGRSAELAGVAEWQRQWPAIDDDMGEMLTTMEGEIGHFDGIAALPPFPLFPWFFVIPGVLAAGLAAAALRAGRAGRSWGGVRVALVALGIGLVAAPAVFQMFTRAPGGARMLDEFRPLMTGDRVTTVQRYFLVLGAAEGELRTQVLAAEDAASLPATERFVGDWPEISGEMAPMIGAMADNLDNYAAVDALPPFWLFPWFFVAPGLLVAGRALSARGAAPATVAANDTPLLERTPA